MEESPKRRTSLDEAGRSPSNHTRRTLDGIPL
jgi:hypothetical protein